MISSTSNDRIKGIIQLKNKSKFRYKHGKFLVEGIRMYKEIPKQRLVETYVSETYYKHLNKSEKHEIDELKDNLYVVADHVFKAISDTVTPQGILAVVRMDNITMDTLLNSNKRCFLILENLQDPGNLGTILRTAEGAGVDGIIMSPDTVDIYNPKVVRSTMGSMFRVPFVYTEDIFETVNKIKDAGVKVYAGHLKGKSNYYEEDYTVPSAFMIGNEGNGLTDKLTKMADCLIKIPMYGRVESLNAASAATILMYESLRQNKM